MKLLLYGDLQATEGDVKCFTQPDRRLQEWRVEKFLGALYDVYVTHGCAGLVDLGDTTDDRTSIPVPTINALLGGLVPFTGWNVKLIGNHEQYLRNTSVHVGRLFDRHFAIFDEFAVMPNDFTDDLYVFAAYPNDYAKLTRQLYDVSKQHPGRQLVLFGHFSVLGSKIASGTVMEGVPRDALRHFTLGFLGHIHKPQTVVPNVYYLGSPFQQHWGEAGENKRMAVFDTETHEVLWIPMDAYGFPCYRTVTTNDFYAQVEAQSEDRYKVILHSQAEAEKLFAHPLCTHAEPIYEYGVANVDNEEIKDWTFDSILARWMTKNPPARAGISLTGPELLEIGLTIASGQM